MKKHTSKAQGVGNSRRIVAQNRRARHEYDILSELECGIELKGSEVKSIRESHVQIQDAFARIISGELWIFQMNVSPYEFAHSFSRMDPMRPRKLLAHREEIDELMGKLQQKALTLVPLSIYFKEGHAKILLGLARGRKLYDKRRAVAERDAKREAAREMANAARNRF